jgi:hypothetical protein
MTSAAPAAPGQRPYTPPALVVHGTVQTLTQSLGSPVDRQVGASFLPPGG